jgi:hypothetical protein
VPRKRSEAELQKINTKRIALIHKDFAEGLTDKERKDLDRYNAILSEAWPHVTPQMWTKLRELECHISQMKKRNKDILKSLQKLD